MKGCECEHESHFNSQDDADRADDQAFVPPTGHPYGSQNEGELIEMRTHWGTFRICKGCHEGHPYPPEYIKDAMDKKILPNNSPIGQVIAGELSIEEYNYNLMDDEERHVRYGH